MSRPATAVLFLGLGLAASPFLQVAAGLLAARIHEWNMAKGR